MIKFGPLMIFPDAYLADAPDPDEPEFGPTDNPVERAERALTPPPVTDADFLKGFGQTKEQPF